jgi:methionine synthase II (cobalamin-independent)
VGEESAQAGRPWATAAATGIGSMPGTDPAEAMRTIAGELPEFPHIPELPERGPGADLTGRTVALLVDMPAEVTPRGWRLAERKGRDIARARTMLSTDLDVLEEVLQDYEGPLKIQVCGPWTLAATLELTRTMDAALSDRGAVADLAASLAEGVRAHAAEVSKRVPGARLVVQLDEPALPAVVAGEVPTASGISRLPAIETETLQDRLATVLAAQPGYTVVHSCASAVPFAIIRTAGASAVSFDLGRLRLGEEDAVGEVAEAGMGLLIGAVPTINEGYDPAAEPADSGAGRGGREAAERVHRLWRLLGLSTSMDQVVVTPGCGLAGASPAWARAALARCREAARILPEMAEEAER